MEVENLYGIDLLQISWLRWVAVSVFVLFIYMLIRLLHDASEKMSLLGGWKKILHNIIYATHILSEPIGILIVLISFILINPILHGLLVLLVFISGFTLIKSYFLGRMMQLKNESYTGQKIRFKGAEGFIKKIGRTSLTLQTEQGAKHISYAQIFNEGFTQLQGNDIGGLQSVYIDTSDTEHNTIQNIKDRLWESPYLDWSFEPEVTITNKKNQFQVKMLLSERSHLDDLINLISEWGYQCRLKI